MKIAIALFPGFTALDAIGPYEVLHNLPDADLDFVAEAAGPVACDTGKVVLNVARSFADVPDPDIILIPGGGGTRGLVANGGALVEWIRAVHPGTLFTTSVCTGSLVLGTAGVLQGLEATTHWAVLDSLAKFGAVPVSRRVVAARRGSGCGA